MFRISYRIQTYIYAPFMLDSASFQVSSEWDSLPALVSTVILS